MTWWMALLLGVIEGVTEFLPVSSTGHLILASWLLKLDQDQAMKDAAFSFDIVIQAGAIAAVLGLYWPRVRQMMRGMMGQDPVGRRLAINLVVAFLPALVSGVLLSKTIKAHLNGPMPVIAALIAGAVLMLAVSRKWGQHHAEGTGRGVEDVDWRMALIIGIAQCVALWPGTSRSMMTIVAGLLLGLRPAAAAEFGFLLGLITLSAATAKEGYEGGSHMLEQFGAGNIALGFIAATISAAIAVHWFVGFLNRRGLAPFAWYRLALAAVMLALVVS